MGIDDQFDVFISHASEDKARFVEPLIVALRERGIRPWYDTEQIRLGDDFRRKMDEGLSRARFGVVILSPRFFKYWPEAELSALFAQEAAFDQARILPIRCELDRATLTMRSPLLATRADVGWEMGVPIIADRIRDRVRDSPVGSRTTRSPLYNLPSRRARQLFGRELDLQHLNELLVPGRSVQVAASIEGLAGVGKTELALHIVDRLAETGRFPGGIFWFDAENPDLITAWGSTIADALAVGAGTLDERAAAALRIASSDASILIVLDNIEKWTRESEPKPLPHGSHIALLVTTRHRFLAGPAFVHHTLEVLPADAARAFLVSVAGRNLAHSPGTEDLLNHLDGHSLAIELAGAYLHEFPSVTPAEYLKRLEEGLPVEEKVQDLVRYEATVRSALDVHWSKLDEKARGALLVAACFAADDATIALLEACGVDADAQQPLRRFHLITGDGERWRMHRLVHEWARRIASTQELAQVKRKFVEGCVEYSRRITLVEGFRIYRADGKHLEEASREAAGVLGSDNMRVSLLHYQLATGLHSMGDLPRAKELLELVLTSDLRNLAENHPSVAICSSNLANVLSALGDLPRAAELLELALASALTYLDEDHPFVATDRSNLALVLRNLGDLPRAKELLELALASDLKNLGEDHSSVAACRSNLGLVLQDLGDLPRAKELLGLALASSLKNLGEDHPSVATARSSLALVLRDLGDLPHAKELLELGLASALTNLGENHPSVTTRRSNLASILQDLGDLPRAKDLLELALISDLNNLGEDHPSVATRRSNLALVLHELGDLPRAKELLELALASDLKNLGENHPSVAVILFNLGTLSYDGGDLACARALFSRSLSKQECSFGVNHPSTAYARAALSDVLSLLGETESARAEAERALQAVANQPNGSRYRFQVERIAVRVLGPK